MTQIKTKQPADEKLLAALFVAVMASESPEYHRRAVIYL